MYDVYLGFKFSFAYFSRLPMPFSPDDDLSAKRVLASMLFFFPFVGLVLAGLSIGLYLLLAPMGWYAGLLSALFYMMLYGFLHTEAVVDVVDALYASHAGKDAYEVIKEPTVGAMGMLYSVGFIIAKVGGISYLLLHGFYAELITISMASRLSLLLLFNLHTFRSSFSTAIKEAFSYRLFLLACVIFALPTLIIAQESIILFFLALTLAIIISYTLKQRLGFINGDLLGMTVESIEIILLITVARLWL